MRHKKDNRIEGEVKKRILDTAENLFFEKGITTVTMDEVAHLCGISKKTLYQHFYSKDELIKSIVEEFLTSIKKEFSEIRNSSLSSQQKIVNLLVTVVKCIKKLNRQFPIDLQRFYPDLWNMVEDVRRENFSLIKESILDKETTSFRKDIPAELFFEMFLCVVQGVLNPKVLSRNSFSLIDAFNGVLKILFEGYLTSQSREWFHQVVDNLLNIKMEITK